MPVEFNGGTSAAVAGAWRDAELRRKREAEARSGKLVDDAWAWVDSRPVLAADPDLSLFAVQAITLRRIPQGLSSANLEAWLLGAWQGVAA